MSEEKIFNSSQSSLYELLDENSHFSIPRHQRAYSWGSDQIVQFLDDIFDVQKKQEESKKLHEYFFGPIVLFRQKSEDRINRYQVLDGQQRLSTTCIFVAIIRDLLDELEQHEDASDFHNRLYQKQRPYRPEFWRITSGKKNEDYFNDLVLTRELPSAKLSSFRPDRYNKQIEFAYTAILERLTIEMEKSADKAKFLIEICENFLWSFKVIKIEVSSAANAYKIFETLNAEGLELTITDLIRNHILSEVERDNEDKIADRFENILDNVESTDLDTYIRVHWLAHHKVRPNKQEFYKKIAEEKNAKDIVIEYVDSLLEFSKIYHGLVHPNSEEEIWWKDPNILRTLNQLKALTSTVCYPLLLIARKKFERKDFQKLADSCLIWFFRARTASQTNASVLEKLIVELATEVRENDATVDDVRKMLVDDPTNPDDTQFENSFSGLIVKSPPIQKYILLQIERFYADNPDTEPIDSITVEHILPRNIPEGSKWKKLYDAADHERLLHRIGNLTLLKKEENSTVKDWDFDKKCDKAFGSSTIKITNELVGIPKWNIPKDEKDPVKIEDWSEEIIKKRQIKFSVIAVNVWKFE